MPQLPNRYETLAKYQSQISARGSKAVKGYADEEANQTDKLVNTYLAKIGSNIPQQVKDQAKIDLTRLIGQNKYDKAREYVGNIVGAGRSIKKNIKTIEKPKPMEEMQMPETKQFAPVRPLQRNKNIIKTRFV